MSYSFKFMAKKDKKKEEVKEVKKEEEKKLPPSQQLKKVATEHYKNIDKVLEKVEPVVYIAKKYEFSRLSVTLILIGMLVGVILICLNIKGAFITDIIAYIYPAYKTIKSIDIAEKEKDKHFPKQWLSYWLMFGFYKLMENFNEHLLKVFPFYYILKTVIILWLVLPQTHGALFLYQNVFKHWIPIMDKVAVTLSPKKPKPPSDSPPNVHLTGAKPIKVTYG